MDYLKELMRQNKPKVVGKLPYPKPPKELSEEEHKALIESYFKKPKAEPSTKDLMRFVNKMNYGSEIILPPLSKEQKARLSVAIVGKHGNGRFATKTLKNILGEVIGFKVSR